MSQISRNLDGPYQRGVANPYTAHVHPYPTRFHGAIYTRPVFGKPFVLNPHAVFKPDDFYEYYGVEGLGSVGGTFHGSSTGNGVIGGNTLGLGATGTPIYYLASRANTKVSTLQAGLNKVLTSQRFPTIPITGKFGDKTIAALSICMANFKEDTLAQVDSEIVFEAVRTGDLALKNSAVQKRAQAIVAQMKANRSAVPPEPLTSPTAVVPPDGPVPNDPTPPPVVVAPSIPTPVPPEIQEPTPLPATPTPPLSPITVIPEMEISARPPQRSHGKMGLTALLVVGGGVGYYLWKKKKK